MGLSSLAYALGTLFAGSGLSFVDAAAESAPLAQNIAEEISAAPEEVLASAEASYVRGDYEISSRRISGLLRDDSRLAQAHLSRLYLLKTRLVVAFHQEEDALYWLEHLYDVDASIVLDPVKDPPVIQETWAELKQRQAQKQDLSKNDGDAATMHTRPAPRPVYFGLMPFGIGHWEVGRGKDGLLFFSTEWLALMTASHMEVKTSRQGDVFALASFVGVYGYEVLSLLPDLYARDSVFADRVNGALSLAPFGGAQIKNGDVPKAVSLAVIQTLLLTVGTVAHEPEERRASLGFFGMAVLYGMIDGVRGHKSGTSHARTLPWKAQLSPISGRYPGGMLSAGVEF